MRGQLATRVTDLVDHHYGFEDLKNSTVIEKNKNLCEKLKLDTAFYFKASMQKEEDEFSDENRRFRKHDLVSFAMRQFKQV